MHPALTARADRRLIRTYQHSHRFVLVEVTAPPSTQRRERPPVNLAFVLDRSGSMSGGKLELAKRAVEEAIAHLGERDRFSIVTYDDTVEVVCESRPATREARLEATDRLRQVGTGGSTNLSGGWLAGCEAVARFQSTDGVDRVLLLTDGLANVGIVDHDELTRHAAELRARGVATSTFGVGRDFDEALLQAMADAGGGHFYYIADAAQIRDHIASEVGEALEVVARDVELELLGGEGVRVEAISPHPLEARGTRSLVRLGDLVAEQTLDVVLRLEFPYGELGRETGLIIRVTDKDGVFEALGTKDARLTWAWAADAANDGQARDVDVDRAVARQFAARARTEAVRRNKVGDFQGAQQVMRLTARRMRGYAGRDHEMRELVADLEQGSAEFGTVMAPALLKEIHFSTANQARFRDAQGRARKTR